MILATDIFQARRDVVLDTSKILLDNSNHESWNVPINSTTLFGNKIKEVAKSNFEAQQQRFLATSSAASTMQQQQKVTCPTPPVFKRPKQPTKFSRPQQMQSYRPKSQTQSYSSNRKEYAKRSGNQKQFTSSKQASSSTKYWCPTLSTASPTRSRHSSGRKVGPFCGTMGRIDNKWVLSIVRNGFKIPFKLVPSLSVVPIKLSQSSSLFLREEIAELLKKRAVERVRNPGTPGFYSRIFLVPKKNGNLVPVIDLSLLNQYINKHFKMKTVKSVRQSIMANNWAVSIDLMDAYLHVLIHPISTNYLWFVFEHQVFQSVDFHTMNECNNSTLMTSAVPRFPYLDNWLIRGLIHNRLISHTKYTLQTVQNLGFIPNLKKSDLIPTQQFIFIGMEFLTQQEIVRVPADWVKALILTIKTILSQTLNKIYDWILTKKNL